MQLRTAYSLRRAARSLLKFSVFGTFTFGIAYEGLHLYVEHIQLAPDSDPELRKWGWTERWTGDPNHGGTDPALGLRGRHLVRAAWMASNWSSGHSTVVVNPSTDTTEGLPGPGGSRVVDVNLQRTDEFLRSAIQIAEKKLASGALSSSTLHSLLLHHASVLERLEDTTSKSQYERAWAMSPEAHVAWKLGDLNSRLGQTDDALAWWGRAILLACGKNSDSREPVPMVPSIAPSSPQAQRTLTSALVSLSSFYATSGQFKKAQQVEESALDLIRSIPPPTSLATASPAQALHALYLLHRSSLLSVHLAEVLHAQKKPSSTSIQWLTSAAESSERVAYALTGLPLDSFHRQDSVPQDKRLLNTYTSSHASHAMNKVASTLLRDASRTAAEAWHLIGVLHEASEGPTSGKALKCYERAVEWAGKTVSQSDTKVAGDGILEAEWNMIWSSYNRLRQGASRDK